MSPKKENERGEKNPFYKYFKIFYNRKINTEVNSKRFIVILICAFALDQEVIDNYLLNFFHIDRKNINCFNIKKFKDDDIPEMFAKYASGGKVLSKKIRYACSSKNKERTNVNSRIKQFLREHITTNGRNDIVKEIQTLLQELDLPDEILSKLNQLISDKETNDYFREKNILIYFQETFQLVLDAKYKEDTSDPKINTIKENIFSEKNESDGRAKISRQFKDIFETKNDSNIENSRNINQIRERLSLNNVLSEFDQFILNANLPISAVPYVRNENNDLSKISEESKGVIEIHYNFESLSNKDDTSTEKMLEIFKQAVIDCGIMVCFDSNDTFVADIFKIEKPILPAVVAYFTKSPLLPLFALSSIFRPVPTFKLVYINKDDTSFMSNISQFSDKIKTEIEIPFKDFKNDITYNKILEFLDDLQMYSLALSINKSEGNESVKEDTYLRKRLFNLYIELCGGNIIFFDCPIKDLEKSFSDIEE